MVRESNKYPKVNLSAIEKKILVEKLTEEQENKCYLCARVFGEERYRHDDYVVKNRRFLDHNHITGEARKLLCDECNSKLSVWEIYFPIESIMKRKILEQEYLTAQIQAIEQDIKSLQALQQYIKTGVCTSHILANNGGENPTEIQWPSIYKYTVGTNNYCGEDTIKFNEIASQSPDMAKKMQTYLKKCEARAIKWYIWFHETGGCIDRAIDEVSLEDTQKIVNRP